MNYSTISQSALPADMKAELLLTNYLWVLLRNPLPTQKKRKEERMVGEFRLYKKAFLCRKAN